MRLADIEDADKLVTKEYLDVRIQELEHRISDQFHKEMLGLIQWMGGFFLGFATVILGGVYFILMHGGNK
jgi:hypothetical protein